MEEQCRKEQDRHRVCREEQDRQGYHGHHHEATGQRTAARKFKENIPATSAATNTVGTLHIIAISTRWLGYRYCKFNLLGILIGYICLFVC
jgi:hypothetical protein